MFPRRHAGHRWIVASVSLLILSGRPALAETVAFVSHGAETVNQEAAGTPPARSRPTSGFEYALRTGVSFGTGTLSGARSLGAQLTTRVPVWVDIGYRLNRRISVAVFGQVGIDGADDGCGGFVQASDVRCSVEDWSLGAEVFVHIIAQAVFDVWVGGGVGWDHINEAARFSVQASTEPNADLVFLTAKENHEGPSWLLQLGMDWTVEGALRAGPFVAYAAGIYTDRSYECSPLAKCPAGEVDSPGLHHFGTVGVRGVFGR